MRLLLTSALAALAISGPVLAQTALAPSVSLAYAPAQAAVSSGDAEWALRVGPRLVAELRSSTPAVRSAALHAVANLAYATPEGADIRPAVPALLDVFRTDPDRRLRAMALRSLQAAADEGVMETLWAEAGREDDPYVQRTLLAVLAHHYGVSALRQDPRMVATARSLLNGRRNGATQ